MSTEEPDVIESPSIVRRYGSPKTYKRRQISSERMMEPFEMDLGDFAEDDLELKAIDECLSRNRFPFLALPKDIQVLILYMIDALDLLAISQTCKELRILTKQECIWRSQVLKKWCDLKSHPVRWKEYFYHRTAFVARKSECLTWKCKGVSENDLPSPRQSLSASVVNGNVYYIGGQTSITSRFDDIFVFNTDTRKFYLPNTKGKPPKFARHTAATVGTKIYVFGGFDGVGTFFNLQIFDTEKCEWISNPPQHGETPVPRTNHAVTVDDKYLYLFGGNDTTNPQLQASQYGTFGDFWRLDTETMVWSVPPSKGKTPCPRSGHHMVTIDHKIYLYGGGLWDDSNKMWLNRYNDMWVYNTATGEWTEIKQQCAPRVNFISLPHWHIGCFIFTLADSLWCFDTLTECWYELPPHGQRPQKRFLGTAVKIPNKHEVYLFGGVYSEVVNYFDLLSWNNASIYNLLSLPDMSNVDQGDISVYPRQ